MRIDPKLLIDFVTIADEGSFTHAARRLRVAQPWLSARFHKLEEVIGFRLFDRTTRTVALTPRGADLLGAARRVAEASAAAERLALELKRRSQSVVRIGAAPYTKLIRKRRELIETFALSHRDVTLELEVGWSLALLSRLDMGDLDLSFMMGDVDNALYENVLLDRFGLAVTVANNHPFAAISSLPLEALRGRAVQVFTRNLNPLLWDIMYSPLVEIGADFVEVAQMAEGPPDRMSPADAIAAFFDFGDDLPNNVGVVRIPVVTEKSLPFQLIRRVDHSSREGQALWDLALASSPFAE